MHSWQGGGGDFNDDDGGNNDEEDGNNNDDDKDPNGYDSEDARTMATSFLTQQSTSGLERMLQSLRAKFLEPCDIAFVHSDTQQPTL